MPRNFSDRTLAAKAVDGALHVGGHGRRALEVLAGDRVLEAEELGEVVVDANLAVAEKVENGYMLKK